MNQIQQTATVTGSIVVVELYAYVLIFMVAFTIVDLFKKYKNRKK